jgi:hypothetical protein
LAGLESAPSDKLPALSRESLSAQRGTILVHLGGERPLRHSSGAPTSNALTRSAARSQRFDSLAEEPPCLAGTFPICARLSGSEASALLFCWPLTGCTAAMHSTIARSKIYVELSGRAFPSHGRGRRFNPYSAHHIEQILSALSRPSLKIPPRNDHSIPLRLRSSSASGAEGTNQPTLVTGKHWSLTR